MVQELIEFPEGILFTEDSHVLRVEAVNLRGGELNPWLQLALQGLIGSFNLRSIPFQQLILDCSPNGIPGLNLRILWPSRYWN